MGVRVVLGCDVYVGCTTGERKLKYRTVDDLDVREESDWYACGTDRIDRVAEPGLWEWTSAVVRT